MLKRYETLLLATTKTTDDELAMIERQFDQILSAHKGKMSTFDKWGKYRLAFPVGKSDYGYYILVRYEAPSSSVMDLMKELDSFFKIKCNEIIMRHTTVALSKDAPNTYIKPEALDAVRTGGIDAFLKENKMENLLESIPGGQGVNESIEFSEDIDKVEEN